MNLLTYKNQKWTVCAIDEAAVERRADKRQDPVLGSRHGRLASTAADSAAEVVAIGNRASRPERDRLGNTDTEHADSHVRVLSKQVGFVGDAYVRPDMALLAMSLCLNGCRMCFYAFSLSTF